EDFRAARHGGNQCCQHPDQRGLPRTVGTQQAEDLTVLDGKRDSIDGREISEPLRNLVNFDIGHIKNFGIRNSDFGFERRFPKFEIRIPNSEIVYCIGNSTYVVIPTARRRSLLSTRKRISNVLMSRFVRLTSRWVAKPASTAR